ncbi:MAG: type II/IV secretion system ATPase subunit [Candidatus Woesearchaeota archaeon]|nr:type II/IV secretion system ATPase subunit [Candidatus Woesearchaeota archaeon]
MKIPFFSRIGMAANRNNPAQKSNEAKIPRKETEALLPPEKIKFEIDIKPRLIVLPEFRNIDGIDIRYPLISPYAFAHIFWDSNKKELVYDVEEYTLSETEKELLKLIMTGLEETINVSLAKIKNAHAVIDYLEKNVQSILSELGAKLSEKSYKKIMYYVYRNSIGMNQIEPLLNDYYIEDIECNGVGFPIYIVHRKYENLRTNVIFRTNDELMNFVEKLAQKCDKYISYAKPLLDGALPDGSRVNATYAKDITTRGPTFTIRKFTTKPLTPVDMIRNHTASPEAFAYLSMLIENKYNIMFIGETASGKTTFLNSVMNFIPSEARICSIEDTRELNLNHSNWIPAVSRVGVGMRGASEEAYGEVSMFELLRETFRQNPDYVIVGEVRGTETFVLFQGMASGHPSYSTFHAGSVESLVKRLQTPPINLPASLIESLDVVCMLTHIKEPEKNIRRLIGIKEIKNVKEQAGVVEANDFLTWDPFTDSFVLSENSYMFEKISKKRGVSVENLYLEMGRRSALFRKISEQKGMDYKEFERLVNSYYKNPKAVLKKYGITG